MKIDFCIPVYNEDEIFSASAEKVWAFLQSSFFDHDWRLVFAVNGSSQKFIDAVKKFTDNNRPGSACFIIEKSGKGGAIKACFDASTADILVYMDIDLAVDLDDIFSLLRPVLDGQADFCFGSRMLPSSVKLRSWRREISSKAYIRLSRFLLRHHFTDLQCGFKAIKRSAWLSLSPKIVDRAWFFDTELICLAERASFKIMEIPVNWSENRYSRRRSKVKVWREAFIFLKKTMALRRRLGR